MFKPVSIVVTVLLTASSNAYRCRNNPAKFPTPTDDAVMPGSHDSPIHDIIPTDSMSFYPTPSPSIYVDDAFSPMEGAPKPCNKDASNPDFQMPMESGPETSTTEDFSNQMPLAPGSGDAYGAYDASVFHEHDEVTDTTENVEGGSAYPVGQPSGADLGESEDAFIAESSSSESTLEEAEPIDAESSPEPISEEAQSEPVPEPAQSPEPVDDITETPETFAAEDLGSVPERENVDAPVPVPSRFRPEEDLVDSQVKKSDAYPYAPVEVPAEDAETPVDSSSDLKSGMYTIGYAQGHFLGFNRNKVTGRSDASQWEIKYDEGTNEFLIRSKADGRHYDQVIRANNFFRFNLNLKDSEGSRFYAEPTGLPNEFYLQLTTGRRAGLWLAMKGNGNHLKLAEVHERTAFTFTSA